MSMRNVKKAAASVLVLIPTLLFSAPVPKIDSANFDVGVLKEGVTSELKHTFQIKNIGDSTLKLLAVRARCGCTAVSYDTVIQPGKTGHLVAQVNPQGFPDGQFDKSIAIMFNNDKFNTSVTVHGVWKHMVVATPDQVEFFPGHQGDSGATITIETELRNFNVVGVNFSPDNGSGMDWNSSIPVNFSFSKVAEPIRQANGKLDQAAHEHSYKLTVRYKSNEKHDRYGQLVIKTNNPGKPDFKVGAVLRGRN